ncbi:polyadenylate-binding protein 7-like isoform X1 [Salvia splendens]|uniref:polyadenylate-binding protein 7-like isoform X1 n=1 Tax=Salvia splendens TaxID=180675 RepID=UPI001C272A61|nr:polyadenylate-binding protein 7-like isoform X1 [Salvia splendens]
MATESAVPIPASLYVGDLHPDVSDAVLLEAFKEFNSLSSVRVCLDSATGRSLGYGYVNFDSPHDALQAIELKNHLTLNGKAIRVMWSHRDSDERKSGVGNVFVKNLSDSIDSVKLQEMFRKFGDIISCKVVTSDDGKSRGYGFVQFESEASAKAAIEKLNGADDGGKQMYVSKFIKKSDRAVASHEVKYTNLYVKNLDTGISEEVFKEKFSQYGKIVSLVISKDENGASRGFGFVNFDKAEDAKSAVEALNGSQLASKVLYVARAQKKSERQEMLRLEFEEKRKEQILKYQASNVYVKNIDDEISDDELRLHFSQCGTITSATIMRDDKGISKGFGFVCFSTPEEANKAVYTFHGLILRRKPLYAAIAQRKEERQVQLQVIHAQRLAGLSGPPSPVMQGGYSHFYYPPGVVPQIPAQPSLLYQQPGIRPGWRANGIPNPSRPVFHPSPIPLPPNSSRQRQRGRMNGNILPHPAGLAYPSHLQRPIHPLASSKDSNNQQPILMSSGVGGNGSEMLSSLLAAAPPEQQKHILGERLYPLVAHHQPELAAKITGMLLEMDNSELLVLLDSPESLSSKVEEAVQVLKLSNAKVSNSNAPRSNYLSARVAVK